MNTFIKISNIICLVASLLFASACGKEDPFPGNAGSSGKTGTVNFRKMMVEVNASENTVRANSVDVGTFLVEITSAQGKTEYAGTYAELPEVITLPVADYTVTVKSPSCPPAAWDTPYYEGSQSFSVSENEVIFVDPVVCRLSNIKVTVKYDAALLRQMADDCMVTVRTGVDAVLQFDKQESRSGYFKYEVGEGTPTLIASFYGTVEGNLEENLRTYTDVAPGNHYIITYTLHSPDTPTPDPTGSITAGVKVDATVQVVDINVNVDIDDDILDDNDRPNQGEDPGPGPGPEPGEGNPPAVYASVNGENIDFNTTVQVESSMAVTVKVDSEAEAGITEFKINIDSSTLKPEILEEVGLANSLDLINPGTLKSGLQDLGFPVENDVKGQSSVSFDISQFVPLLGIYGEGDHKFIITVSDSFGTTVKTLHFITK